MVGGIEERTHAYLVAQVVQSSPGHHGHRAEPGQCFEQVARGGRDFHQIRAGFDGSQRAVQVQKERHLPTGQSPADLG